MSKILFTSQQKYLDKFLTERDPLIKEIESYSKEKNIPILDKHAAQFLEQMILISRPKKVLEIGTAVGYSSILIARMLRKKGSVDTIEKSTDNIELANDYIQRAELSDKINLISGDALEIMPTLDEKYDFIFLDADKEDYERLFYYSIMLLNQRGILFVDNLLWHGYTAASKVPPNYRESTRHIRDFNELFTSQPALETTILPIGDGIGLGVKV